MFSRKPRNFSASWLLFILLFSTCSEDDPIQFGNDGAVLTEINISNSVALISSVTTNDLVTVDGHTYFNEHLYTVTPTGAMNEASLSITGKGNGFEKYTLNDLNSTYFLISFYQRKESYLVEKKSGVAVRTEYVSMEELSMNDDYRSMQPYAFYGVHNNNFYFKDADQQWFHVSNFQSGSAVGDPITFDKFPEKLFFDSKGGIYFTSQHSLYYSTNGISNHVVTDHVGIFNSRDGALKVVQENGTVSDVLDGKMLTAFTVPGMVYPWNLFKAFHFDGLGKSFAIYTQKTTGKTILYNLDARVVTMELVLDRNPLNIISADVYNNSLMILHQTSTRQMLRIIDMATNQIIDVDVTGMESNFTIEHFHAVSNNLMLVDICRMEAGGLCYQEIKILKSSGVANSIGENSIAGKIIPLN